MTGEWCSIINRMSAVSFWKWKKNKCYFFMKWIIIWSIILTTLCWLTFIVILKCLWQNSCFFHGKKYWRHSFHMNIFLTIKLFFWLFKKIKTQRNHFVLNFKISNCKSVEFQCFDFRGIHNQISVTKNWNPRCNLLFATSVSISSKFCRTKKMFYAIA